MNFSATVAVHIAVLGAAIGVVVTAGESLWLWSRGCYDINGMWSWTVVREAHSKKMAAVLSPVMSNGPVGIILFTRLGAGLAIPMLYAEGQVATVPFILLIVMHCFMQLRSRWGGEGSDQMTTLALIAGLVTDLYPDRPLITASAAVFIGAQITLSYLASGSAKLFGPLWRSGEALPKVMNHYTYGHRRFAGVLARYPLLGKVACRSVIVFQITFWMFYLLPMPYALVYPLGGMFFHGSIAYLMRLNLFIPAFISTYPCLFFTRDLVRGMLFG
jgi:hypothetical protein